MRVCYRRNCHVRTIASSQVVLAAGAGSRGAGRMATVRSVTPGAELLEGETRKPKMTIG